MRGVKVDDDSEERWREETSGQQPTLASVAVNGFAIPCIRVAVAAAAEQTVSSRW